MTDLEAVGNEAIRRAAGNDPSCFALFDEVVAEVERRVDDPHSRALAEAFFQRGRAYVTVAAARDLDRAESDLRRARALYAATSSTFDEADCLGQLGVVDALRYEASVRRGAPRGPENPFYRSAKQLWEDVLGLVSEQRPNQILTTISNLAQLCLDGGELDVARDYYQDAVRRADVSYDREEGARAAYGLALAMAALSGREAASVYGQDALARADALGQSGAALQDASIRLLESLG
jgi:tetratricopeptide (TPR) repeat protein